MTPLKWFAGGRERRCEAMAIIDYLLEDIKDVPQLTLLKNLLVSYKRRLEDDGTSTPFILSQMNVDISRVYSLWLLMKCRDRSLSKNFQSNKLHSFSQAGILVLLDEKF